MFDLQIRAKFAYNVGTMRISVFVPTIRPDTLPFAIRSILRQTWPDWVLTVVAQGPYPTLEATVAQAGHSDPRIRILRMPRYGVSHARTAGVMGADGHIIAMMDDDCEAREDWLEVVAEMFAAQPEIGVVGGAVRMPPATQRRIHMCPLLEPGDSVYDPALSLHHPPKGWDFITANVAVRRELAQSIGEFDPYLGTGSRFSAGEDTDWRLRLESAKIKMAVTSRSVVTHTYGVRYGMKAVMQMSRAYARGNGAVAGKLTLMGDPRGEQWLRQTVGQWWLESLQTLRPHRLPFAILRARHFREAYHECVTQFCVNEHGLLEAKSKV